MLRIATRLNAKIKRRAPVGVSGALRAGYEVSPGDGANATIQNNVPYAGAVEFGSEPHMPPIAPLKQWARRVLGLTDDEAREAAWAIAKSIEDEGTEAQPHIRPALDELRSELQT